MNNIEVKLEDSIKYLGINIDKKLNWNSQIDYTYNKLIRTVLKIPIIARNVWGVSYESSRIIYTAAIEPSLLYCVSVWGQKLTKRQFNKLKKNPDFLL
jgi:hypothetical protein